MERSEVGLGIGVGGADGGGGNSKGGDGFVDRSKVRILLCDNDAKSSEEVFELLCKCSYQVTSVRSPRQVIDALIAEGPDIDIILSEVDLPMAKGMKMLKYIMRDKELRRIPVIMMSRQDEVSIVVKCLKLGAADYLVKPLRTNELLNLWTHMWRRRRMLGLAEKNIFIYDFDLVVSDPSDANTNSTTLFSDDTDEKSRKSANPEMCLSNHQEDETNAATAAAPVETPFMDSSENQLDVPENSDLQAGQISSWPKKSELKIGESSAFFTYVKSNIFKSNSQSPVHENAPQYWSIVKEHMWAGHMGTDSQGHANREAQDGHSRGDDHPSNNSIPDSFSVGRSCTPPLPQEFSQGNPNIGGVSNVHMHPTTESQHDVQGFHPRAAYSYYVSGVMNQAMMQSSAQMYQKNLPDPHHNAYTAMLSQFSHMAQCPPHMSGMPSFPYCPVSTCLQPGQMPATHPWQSYGTSSEEKMSKVHRREVALMKFRQKRKERCFDKKIRYVNRKRLAERRPRVRGQFVRKTNGVNVDLNGHPASADDEDYEEDEEDEEDPAARDSSPEDDTSISQK